MTGRNEDQTNPAFTLCHRLSDGPLLLTEALRCAMMLAEAVRQRHESSHIYGTLHPSSIGFAGSLEELSTPVEHGKITPYTAPEVLQGVAADARSDVFSFGAILYEMITGCRAFAGDTREALAAALTNSTPPSCGIPGIDHLISNCTAKDPAVRFQRMQKVMLELKLLSIRPGEGAVTVTRQPTMAAALRAQSEQFEARMASVIETQEKAMRAVQDSCVQATAELSGRLSHLEAELRPVQARSAMVEAVCQNIMKHIEHVQQNVESIDERVTSLRAQNGLMSENVTTMREYVGGRMHEFEQALKSQSAALASVAAGQDQTDDVVEGVVGAMQLVHTIVFDRDAAFA